MPISIKTEGNFRGLLTLDKQLTFALAKSLTQVAKEGQQKAIEEIKQQLTVRSEWYLPSRKFGVRIKPATKQDLAAEVKSAADWLVKLARAEPHTPSEGRRHVAVPTAAIQPTGREIVRRALRPRQLRKAFVIQTRSGDRLIVRRVGRRSQDLQVLYVLKQKTRRPQRDPLTRAVEQTVKQRFGPILSENLRQALATAR